MLEVVAGAGLKLLIFSDEAAHNGITHKSSYGCGIPLFLNEKFKMKNG